MVEIKDIALSGDVLAGLTGINNGEEATPAKSIIATPEVKQLLKEGNTEEWNKFMAQARVENGENVVVVVDNVTIKNKDLSEHATIDLQNCQMKNFRVINSIVSMNLEDAKLQDPYIARNVILCSNYTNTRISMEGEATAIAGNEYVNIFPSIDEKAANYPEGMREDLLKEKLSPSEKKFSSCGVTKENMKTHPEVAKLIEEKQTKIRHVTQMEGLGPFEKYIYQGFTHHGEIPTTMIRFGGGMSFGDTNSLAYTMAAGSYIKSMLNNKHSAAGFGPYFNAYDNTVRLDGETSAAVGLGVAYVTKDQSLGVYVVANASSSTSQKINLPGQDPIAMVSDGEVGSFFSGYKAGIDYWPSRIMGFSANAAVQNNFASEMGKVKNGNSSDYSYKPPYTVSMDVSFKLPHPFYKAGPLSLDTITAGVQYISGTTFNYDFVAGTGIQPIHEHGQVDVKPVVTPHVTIAFTWGRQ